MIFKGKQIIIFMVARSYVLKEQRKNMVTHQLEARGIKNGAVLDAMRKVKRHRLVPDNLADFAYQDYPLPIGKNQTISQPYIVALMTELLLPEPDHRILEIGTGSGYQAAVLAEIVKEVYTVEIIPELLEQAKDKLDKLEYKNIFFKASDGGGGWPEAAPYDGIIVTAAARLVPEQLFDQLKAGGRMVVPCGEPHEVQILTVYEKTADGCVAIPNIPVQFVPLTGATQNGEFDPFR